MMNFFHVVSVYQLINILLYKKKFCRDKKNCIILRDILVPKIRNMGYLEKEFDRVVIYTDYWKQKEIESQERAIVEYFDALFEKEELELNDNSIIVGCAHNTFGMYLSIKKINFIFLEDAAGLLSRTYILDAINQKQYALKYELICKYGLINGKNPNITKYICDFIAQDDSFDIEIKSKSIDFCVVKELGELSENERNEIIEVFVDVKEIPLKKNSMIVLTQHFANLRSLSFEEQMLIYQIFVDYYTNGYRVVLKPHPDDLMFYPLLFPDLEIIREKFPAEFLPFMFQSKPSAVATISSTSSYSLRSCFDNVIEMGTVFEKDFLKTHKYYITMRLIEKVSDVSSIDLYGCNEIIFRELAKSWNINIEFNSCNEVTNNRNPIMIMDEFSDNRKQIVKFIKSNINKLSFIFINSDMLYSFYDYKDKEIWNYITPIVITKNKTRDEEDIDVASLDTEVIYIASKEERIIRMAKEMELHKNLKYSGIELSVNKLSKEQERIKILEGMLDATERRLVHYIELYGDREE